ncbi:alpha,alpha-trehalose-phosphate synthase (UDP-forming) [Asticcacaulis sp. YBE204]|uniref:alpha,alpha-trehalose-phosphate synthase (UDP-forming) n=1 Tax=Asticcacaulis sp. YBE204 TaxID=1282363 RepID=UPI0003C3C866|nr:alpha,alpha-trehalose-phosphate synthase (UDP-forming) [Asticcacaulis sp. YBE204]ESQ79087.1 alpha,alpha-trehalose-phosphate synthase [Asticcacaulis sp. YBE204]
MSRLIVVSNRVNPPADTAVGTQGGLAMALSAALREENGIWFGWSGQVTDTYTGHLSIQKIGGVTVALTDLEQQDVQEYYNGYANRTLWPLFHYRTDLVAFERTYDEGYLRVNQRFADTLFPLIEKDDLIWVQDYHLLPLAQKLREHEVKNRIGFFLHIPWPAMRVFQTLPKHMELVETLFDYDLIGFQTEDSLSAFQEYVVNCAGGELHADGRLTAFGKTIQAAAFPIGIDAEEFITAANSDKALAFYNLMRNSQAGRKMITGVDRLDYSKGLEERFLAYEQFLNNHPRMEGEVFLMQIATATREEVGTYQDLRARLDSLSGRINGEHATIDWVPVRYVNRAYRRDELAGIYRASQVGLVTPLRDGMNLVAKEFVAAQDERDPGVLILSEFAGAAAQMKAALIVNPFDRQAMAEAISEAVHMPLKERRQRHADLLEDVKARDVVWWRNDFVARLKGEPVRLHEVEAVA